MRAFPNDDGWRALFDAAEVIAPTAANGLTRRIDTAALSVVYKHAHGVTGCLPVLNDAGVLLAFAARCWSRRWC